MLIFQCLISYLVLLTLLNLASFKYIKIVAPTFFCEAKSKMLSPPQISSHLNLGSESIPYIIYVFGINCIVYRISLIAKVVK